MALSLERALAEVRDRLSRLDSDEPLTLASVQQAVRESPWLLGERQAQSLAQEVHDHLAGAGPLAPLLRRPEVTDVVVNAPDKVWLDAGEGLVPAGVCFASEAHVRACAQRLASLAGRALDEAHPWVDAALPDGRRLHAVVPPVAVGSTAISIRSLRPGTFTVDDLLANGTLTSQSHALVTGLVRQRRTLLITGGTGSGKTTFLNCLLDACSTGDRIVTCEDTTELDPRSPNIVRMQSRPAGHGGAGAVALSDLVRQALRMRPDRVVVGEVRGPEIVDLLMAMNTGHTGGMATLHANDAADVPSRVHLLAATAGLGTATVDLALVSAIDAVVHLVRTADGGRQVAKIGVAALVKGRATVTAGWQRDSLSDRATAAALAALAGLEPAAHGDERLL